MNGPDSCLQQAFSSISMPLVEEAIAALFSLVQSEGASPQRILGQAKARDWLESAGSLAYLVETGRLSTQQVDAAVAEIAGHGLSPEAALDRYLLPHIVLAAATPMSLQPAKNAPPPWLVRSVRAMIAVDAAEPLLDPVIAQDWLDGHPGCLTLPWLGRETLPARWLSRCLTPRKFWTTLGRADFWQDPAIAGWLAQAEAIATGGDWPQVDGAPVEDDLFAFSDAWHALTTVRVRQRALPTAQPIVPQGGGLVWDLRDSTLQPLGGSTSVTEAAKLGYLEPPIAALAVPRTLGEGLRESGWQRVTLQLDDPDGVDELLDAVMDLALDPMDPQTLQGPGFSIEPAQIP